MNPCFKRYAMAVLAAAALMAPPMLCAPDGYFALAYGTKSKGLASGGVALPQDSTAARLNPAGMAFVNTRWDGGLAVLNSQRSYTVTGAPSGLPGTFGLFPETVESGKSNTLVPNASVNWVLNDASSFGVTTYGTGTMNTSYPGSAAGGAGTFYGGPAGVSTEQLFVLPTYARKMSPTSAWGVSAVMVFHRFQAKGLGSMAPFVADGVPDNLSDRGFEQSFGIGAMAGFQTEVISGLTLAASYQSKVPMSQLKKYSDLLAEQGGFDIPPTIMAGLAWKATPSATVVFDVEHVQNTEVPSVSNPFSNFLTGVATGDSSYLLGGSNGAGFGWKDVTTYKLGMQWQSSPEWIWRVGARYGRQPVRSSEVAMNILAPSIQEWRLTTGLTHPMGERSELNVSLMFGPRVSVRGTNPLDPPAQQGIELRSRQFEIETSWGRRF